MTETLPKQTLLSHRDRDTTETTAAQRRHHKDTTKKWNRHYHIDILVGCREPLKERDPEVCWFQAVMSQIAPEPACWTPASRLCQNVRSLNPISSNVLKIIDCFAVWKRASVFRVCMHSNLCGLRCEFLFCFILPSCLLWVCESIPFGLFTLKDLKECVSKVLNCCNDIYTCCSSCRVGSMCLQCVWFLKASESQLFNPEDVILFICVKKKDGKVRHAFAPKQQH